MIYVIIYFIVLFCIVKYIAYEAEQNEKQRKRDEFIEAL